MLRLDFSPLEEAQRLYRALVHRGFFDVSTLWRQFYDRSIANDFFRWDNVLIYLVGCAAFLVLWRRRRRFSVREYLDFLVPPPVRQSASIKLDLQWLLAGLLGLPQFVTFLLVVVLAVRWVPAVVALLHIHFLAGTVAQLPTSLRLMILYVVGLLFYEFGLYWAHRLQHHSKFLWQFHKVHHFSRQVNVLTGARVHPVDNVLGSAVGGLAMGVALSLFSNYDGSNWMDLYNSSHQYWWFWVLMAIPLTIGRFGHSHVPFTLGWGEYLLISPAMHIVHHGRDRELHDRNFGALISCWDWIFGTAHRHDYRTTFDLGVHEFGDDHYRNFLQSMFEPFVDAFRIARRAVLSGSGPLRTAKVPE